MSRKKPRGWSMIGSYSVMRQTNSIQVCHSFQWLTMFVSQWSLFQTCLSIWWQIIKSPKEHGQLWCSLLLFSKKVIIDNFPHFWKLKLKCKCIITTFHALCSIAQWEFVSTGLPRAVVTFRKFVSFDAISSKKHFHIFDKKKALCIVKSHASLALIINSWTVGENVDLLGICINFKRYEKAQQKPWNSFTSFSFRKRARGLLWNTMRSVPPNQLNLIQND